MEILGEFVQKVRVAGKRRNKMARTRVQRHNDDLLDYEYEHVNGILSVWQNNGCGNYSLVADEHCEKDDPEKLSEALIEWMEGDCKTVMPEDGEKY